MPDTTPHRATPEQWGDIKFHAPEAHWATALLELRDRLAAAEQRISELEGNHPEPPDSSAAAGSLVEVVATVISEDGPVELWYPDARAAILAVAEWLESQYGSAVWAAALWLREEVERHG